jgi:hypothetical protein
MWIKGAYSASFGLMFSPSRNAHKGLTVEVVEKLPSASSGGTRDPKKVPAGHHLIDSNRLVIRLLKTWSFFRISSTFLIE